MAKKLSKHLQDIFKLLDKMIESYPMIENHYLYMNDYKLIHEHICGNNQPMKLAVSRDGGKIPYRGKNIVLFRS